MPWSAVIVWSLSGHHGIACGLNTRSGDLCRDPISDQVWMRDRVEGSEKGKCGWRRMEVWEGDCEVVRGSCNRGMNDREWEKECWLGLTSGGLQSNLSLFAIMLLFTWPFYLVYGANLCVDKWLCICLHVFRIRVSVDHRISFSITMPVKAFQHENTPIHY